MPKSLALHRHKPRGLFGKQKREECDAVLCFLRNSKYNVFRCKTLDRIIFCQFILTGRQTASRLLAMAGFQLKYLSRLTEFGEAAE